MGAVRRVLPLLSGAFLCGSFGLLGWVLERPPPAVSARESLITSGGGDDPAGQARGTTERVVLREVQLVNRFTVLDDRGRPCAWVELHNAGDGDVALGGWRLQDGQHPERQWQFPQQTIAAGEYLVIWLGGGEGDGSPLSAHRYHPSLVGPDDRWRYSVPSRRAPFPRNWWDPEFDDSGFSSGLPAFGFGDGDDVTVLPRGTMVLLTRRAFHIADAIGASEALLRVNFDDGFVAYLNGQRVASAHAADGEVGRGARATASHEAQGYESFRVPSAVLRQGRNVLAVAGLNYSSRSTDLTLQAELGLLQADLRTGFELSEEGALLLLLSRDGKEIDRLDIPPHAPDHSFGRTATGEGTAFFLTPTPGAKNHPLPHAESIAETVVWEPSGGPSAKGRRVRARAAAVPERRVHYTTDGSLPTPRSPRFESALEIERSTLLRAAVFDGSERASPVSSRSFFVGESFPLPRLSLAMVPEEYAAVHNTAQGRGRGWERPVFLELFDRDGDARVSCGAGIRLHGGDGRLGGFDWKKSYRLYFRGVYGASRLEYPLFGGPGAAPLGKLVLRAGFDDSFLEVRSGATHLRDELIRRLHREMGAVAARGTWCELYVNMRPRGVYNLVDRIDDDFLTAHLGGAFEWDVVKTADEVAAGDAQDWERVNALARDGLRRPQALERFAAAVNLEALTDYVILNTWAQNHDWPDNNWYAARRRSPDGKWFFLCWDAEFGVGLRPTGYRHDSLSRAFRRRCSLRTLLAGVWQNPLYRKLFAERAQQHLATVLEPSNVLAHIEQLEREVQPAIAAEGRRYGFSLRRWRDNVEDMREFARHRNRFFAAHVARHTQRGR